MQYNLTALLAPTSLNNMHREKYARIGSKVTVCFCTASSEFQAEKEKKCNESPRKNRPKININEFGKKIALKSLEHSSSQHFDSHSHADSFRYEVNSTVVVRILFIAITHIRWIYGRAQTEAKNGKTNNQPICARTIAVEPFVWYKGDE